MRHSTATSRLLGLSLALVLVVACDRKPASIDSANRATSSPDSLGTVAPGGSSIDTTASPASALSVARACPVDTIDEWGAASVVPNQDSLRTILDTLDRRIPDATDDQLPALLLRRGRVRTAFRPHRDAPLSGYAKARPDEFKLDHSRGYYDYNGSDLTELTRRFPASELADDAAYAMSQLAMEGGCGRYVGCPVKAEWDRVSSFLQRFPDSPFADSAVARAIGAFRHFHTLGDLRIRTDNYDPEQARKLITSLDSAALRLSQPLRARLLDQVGQLWDRFGERERGLAAYRAALAGAPVELGPCLQARLAAPRKEYLTLYPARALTPNRVQLLWTVAPTPALTAHIIHRSPAPGLRSTVVGRVGGDAFKWIDTTTEADRSYSYFVVADRGGDTTRSNTVSVLTPKPAIRVDGIAVSTTSRHLHVFGVLRNGFPQVIRVSYDGHSVERSDGLFVGLRDSPPRDRKFDTSVEDLWLVDGSGRGVLRFRKTSDALPDEIFTGVRIGSELLPRWLMSGQLLITLNEEPRAIWATGRGDHLNGPVAMDCLVTRAYCWMGSERNVLLRNDAGRHVLVGTLPFDSASTERAADIFADARDGSAWVFMRRAGRLVQIDTTGAVGRELQLVPPGSDGTLIADDLDRRVIWFTHTGSDGVTALARVNIDAPELRVTVVAPDVPRPARMVPDLAGGVWLVNEDWIHRIDGSGAGVVGIRIHGWESR